MSIENLYLKAMSEWEKAGAIRHTYPTFVFYWHERYERVYNISYRH